MCGLAEVNSLEGLCKDSTQQQHGAAAHSHRLTRVVSLLKRTQDEVTCTVGSLDSPTDCPAVYESVLVRERLLPLVFAGSHTGKTCENKHFFET